MGIILQIKINPFRTSNVKPELLSLSNAESTPLRIFAFFSRASKHAYR
jgi:hypothetical protein